ncbi:hypothetical protein HMPREF9120_02475 [Neisseria sp. oral taxon 020 str. F0370]|nr:hypothetical protein HMPREF9120_02475 [Neisseria sp. oral taxon 020 str. F0370]
MYVAFAWRPSEKFSDGLLFVSGKAVKCSDKTEKNVAVRQLVGEERQNLLNII